jgi:hypothetical protein
MVVLVLTQVGYGSALPTDRSDLALALTANLQGDIAAGVKAFYGVFLLRGLEAGPQVSWTRDTGTSLAQAGLHLERTTDLNKSFLPYIGGGISYGQVHGGDENNEGMILHGEIGVKGIASEAFGWSMSLVGEQADSALFGPADDPRRTALSLQISLRFIL